MDATPVIDLTNAAQVALTRMLDTGCVIGHDEAGRSVIAVAVDDWVLDWFGSPGTRLVTNGFRGRRKR
jgi:hypothetical protein